jgi:hypothetical protein
MRKTVATPCETAFTAIFHETFTAEAFKNTTQKGDKKYRK